MNVVFGLVTFTRNEFCIWITQGVISAAKCQKMSIEDFKVVSDCTKKCRPRKLLYSERKTKSVGIFFFQEGNLFHSLICHMLSSACFYGHKDFRFSSIVFTHMHKMFFVSGENQGKYFLMCEHLNLLSLNSCNNNVKSL